MRDRRAIARSTFFLSIAHGASKVFTVGLTAIAGRVLGPAVYGFYGTGATLVEVGRVVANCGLEYLVTREVASDPRSATRVASAAGVVKLITGAVMYAFLVAVVAIVVRTFGQSPQVLTVVLILGIGLFLENLSDVADAVFQGRERMHYITLGLVTSSVVLFLCGAVALLSGLGLVGLCVAIVVAFLVRWLVVNHLLRRNDLAHPAPRYVERGEVARLARAGLPLLGSTVVTLLFHRIDVLMLWLMAAPAQVGLYFAAVRVIDVVVLVPRILATAVFPRLRRAGEESGPAAVTRLMDESTRVTLVLCSALGLTVWILAPVAIRWIPGAEFLPATSALRIMAWGILFQAGSHMMARLLYAADREADFLFIGSWGIACNVLLNFLLIPRMGIDGAALATLISYGVTLALYYFYAARAGFRVPLGTSILRPGAALGVAALAHVMARDWNDPARAGLMVGVWIVASVLLGSVHRGDAARLVGWLRR